jgi:FKBP-type peptidyl-prolyl cis-trans isomerase (trigger factor)
MDESKMIRSRVEPDLSIEDLAVPEELAVYSFDSECVEREIRDYRLKNASMEPGDEIKAGDFIEITINGGDKRLPATVGLGLLGKETEAALLGKRVGDTIVTEEPPRGRRELRICGIQRRILAGFSDQSARELGYDSVEAFRAGRLEELRSQARRAKARELAVGECMSRIAQLALCPWEAELEELTASYRASNAEMFRSRNMDPAALDPDQLEQTFGVRTAEELDRMMAESAVTNLKMAVIGQKIAKEKGMSCDEADYEDFVRTHAQKYLMDEDAVRNTTPFLAMLVEQYAKLVIAEQIARTEASMKEV